MSGSYDKEAVQRFCKDGEQIEMVEISGDYRGLEDHVALIDTPGIDSTDHAHFLSVAFYSSSSRCSFMSFTTTMFILKRTFVLFDPSKKKVPNLYFIVNQNRPAR
ncbi:hypothetical protein ACEQPO_16900 [Bacillus sp. SL00103]